MKESKCIIIAVFISMALLGCTRGESRDVRWTVVENMSEMFDEYSPWILGGTLDIKEVRDGVLRMKTSGTNTGNLVRHELFTNEIGTTVEIRVRFLEAPADTNHFNAAALTFQDGVWEAKLAFLQDKVLLMEPTGIYEYEINTSIYHTYRLTLKYDTLRLYIDGKKIRSADFSGRAVGRADYVLMFGDFMTEEGANFEAEVDYIAYLTGGATGP